MTYLQHVGLTRKERVPGSRRDVHALVSDNWYMAMVTRRDVFEQMEHLFGEGAEAAGGNESPAGRRLRVSQEMSAFMTQEILDAVDRWNAQLAQAKLERIAGADRA